MKDLSLDINEVIDLAMLFTLLHLSSYCFIVIQCGKVDYTGMYALQMQCNCNWLIWYCYMNAIVLRKWIYYGMYTALGSLMYQFNY